ncbi:hypothetical protein RJT17_00085 (plasmid) [Streptomyces sp. P5-A9]|uniref:hypothetical protein n=1 Tax=Streptomyces sp. P5-A9 TaxID=3071730 RepID=UPI002FCC5168
MPEPASPAALGAHPDSQTARLLDHMRMIALLVAAGHSYHRLARGLSAQPADIHYRALIGAALLLRSGDVPPSTPLARVLTHLPPLERRAARPVHRRPRRVPDAPTTDADYTALLAPYPDLDDLDVPYDLDALTVDPALPDPVEVWPDRDTSASSLSCSATPPPWSEP